MSTGRTSQQPVDIPVDKSAAAFSYGRAKILQPIMCVECPSCHSRVHPRVRTFVRGQNEFDEVRGMCPFCGGVHWVYNREQERRADGQKAAKRVKYVFRQ